MIHMLRLYIMAGAPLNMCSFRFGVDQLKLCISSMVGFEGGFMYMRCWHLVPFREAIRMRLLCRRRKKRRVISTRA